MGLSVSAAVAILFIASVIVFGTMISAMDKAQQSLIDAQRTSFERQSEQKQTHFTITSVDAENGTVSILNDGTVTLHLNEIDLFLNGSFSNQRISNEVVDGHPDTNIWLPQEVLTLTINGDINSTAIKVMVGNGISSYA